MGELASVAGRSTNKVSELDTFGIRSGSQGTQLASAAGRLSESQEKDSQKKYVHLMFLT